MLEHYITIRRWNDAHGSVDVSSVERRDLGSSIQWHIIIVRILASLVGDDLSGKSVCLCENALACCN
jgi:hypothetical protein